eukprot:2718483-Amphidinium_carterae.4
MQERIMEKLNAMDSQAEQRLKGLESRLCGLDTTLSSVNRLVQSFDKRLSEMEAKVKELDGLLQKLQASGSDAPHSVFSAHSGGESEPAAKLRRSSSHPPSSLVSRGSRSTTTSPDTSADVERA